MPYLTVTERMDALEARLTDMENLRHQDTMWRVAIEGAMARLRRLLQKAERDG